MMASNGMPCSVMTWTKAVLTWVSAGDSTCSTARSSTASCVGVISIAPCRSPPMASAMPSIRSLGATGAVLVDADGGDEAGALLEADPHVGPEHARRHHHDVAVGSEAVVGQRVAAGDDRAGVGARDQSERRDRVVGDEHAQHVEVGGRGDRGGLEAVGPGPVGGLVGPHAHGDVEPGVAQVERPRSPLVAVADHCDALA